MTALHSNSGRRALFVAYTFPPVGGAGVQRTTKFVKYLPEHGWNATVLTVSNPSVPVHDDSLRRDVPAATAVIRARTFEPSYRAKAAVAGGLTHSGAAVTALKSAVRATVLASLQPDPQILWTGPAFLKGLETLRRIPHDVIIASAPPFSSLLLGAALSRAAGVPLVLDYRDEWDVSHRFWENRQPRGWSVVLQRRMERNCLRHASLVIATSPRSASTLETLCRGAGSAAAVTHLFNGFDPDDFDHHDVAVRHAADRRWRLVYTGTLYRLMSPAPLVAAIEALAATRPDLTARLEVVFAGRRAPEQQQQLARLAPICHLDTRDYVSHAEAIALMRSADALCVLLSDLPGADRIIPAKVFEYIASRRPILAIVPRGDVADVLRGVPAAHTCTSGEIVEIRDWLGSAIEAGAGVVGDPFDTRPFDRRAQAQQLAALLDRVAANAGQARAIGQEVTCSA